VGEDDHHVHTVPVVRVILVFDPVQVGALSSAPLVGVVYPATDEVYADVEDVAEEEGEVFGEAGVVALYLVGGGFGPVFGFVI